MIDINDPDWLDKAVAAAGISIAELSRRSGISRNHLHRLKPNNMGVLCEPRISTLQKIQAALGEVDESVHAADAASAATPASSGKDQDFAAGQGGAA